MKNIVIFLAQIGLIGLLNKNLNELCGKALIAYSIEVALRLDYFQKIIFSTDLEEHAKVVKKEGVLVPFRRSNVTLNDMTSSWDMLDEVLLELCVPSKGRCA